MKQLNTAKKESFDTEKKRQDMITIIYLKANTIEYAADIWPRLSSQSVKKKNKSKTFKNNELDVERWT